MHLAQGDLRTIVAKAGVVDVYPHKFQHTAAVQFLRNDGNLFALQKLLGHITLEMVRWQVELASEDVETVDNWNL